MPGTGGAFDFPADGVFPDAGLKNGIKHPQGGSRRPLFVNCSFTTSPISVLHHVRDQIHVDESSGFCVGQCRRGHRPGGRLEVSVYGGHQRRQRLHVSVRRLVAHDWSGPPDRGGGPRAHGRRLRRDDLPQHRRAALDRLGIPGHRHGLSDPLLLLDHRRLDAFVPYGRRAGPGPCDRPKAARGPLWGPGDEPGQVPLLSGALFVHHGLGGGTRHPPRH